MSKEKDESNSLTFNKHIIGVSDTDINEDNVQNNMPDILNILLLDRTKLKDNKKSKHDKYKNNIIWANNSYIEYGFTAYSAENVIKPELITGLMTGLIKPRTLKSDKIQRHRQKSNSEVFTPTWIVKKQNDAMDMNFLNDDLETYIKRNWLEITCGEAPYMTTRYNMTTGQFIPLEDRVGFIDRKLRQINLKINDKNEWERLAEWAYKSSYGFEWNGDSLLIARENLLYTYRDYYYAKWNEEPIYEYFYNIATIISYNIFQMDGLKYIIPLSEEKKNEVQLNLLDLSNTKKTTKIVPGKRVKIMNWFTNKMEFFDKGVNL